MDHTPDGATSGPLIASKPHASALLAANPAARSAGRTPCDTFECRRVLLQRTLCVSCIAVQHSTRLASSSVVYYQPRGLATVLYVGQSHPVSPRLEPRMLRLPFAQRCYATDFSLAGRIQVHRSFSGPHRINSREELIPGSSDLVGRS